MLIDVSESELKKWTQTQESNSETLPLKVPLLKSESAAEYVTVLERLKNEIKPRGIIEQNYVEQMASLIFDCRRLQLCKINIIGLAYPEALQNILKQLLVPEALLPSAIDEVQSWAAFA